MKKKLQKQTYPNPSEALDAHLDQKVRREYPALFHVNESRLPNAISVASTICESLRKECANCAPADFETHLRTLAEFARSSLSQLVTLAKMPDLHPIHRIRALESFVRILQQHCTALEQFAKSEIQRVQLSVKTEDSIVQFIAQLETAWPANVPRNNKLADAQRLFINKQLGLASESHFNVAGKQSRPTMKDGRNGRKVLSHAMPAAVEIVKVILYYRATGDREYQSGRPAPQDLIEDAKALAPASPDESVKAAWWKVGERVLRVQYGAEFWKDDRFAPFTGKPAGKDMWTDTDKSGIMKTMIERRVKKCFFGCYRPFNVRSKPLKKTWSFTLPSKENQ